MKRTIQALRSLVLVGVASTSIVCGCKEETPEKKIRPFREIGSSLGFRGKNHAMFMAGVSVFDANEDGLLDIYLPHDGRPVLKATTEEGVLTDKNVPALPNTLFLNRGIDKEGNPIFKSVQDLLVHENTTYLKEELLIENKYNPRKSLKEDELSIGRIARGSVAADFNGDGKMDLYVLNAHKGIPSQTKETGQAVYPAKKNIGRTVKKRKPIIVTFPAFLKTSMEDGLNVEANFGENLEREGRNSFYLNLGDRDKDGISEWEDVTEQAGVGGHWDSASATVADIDRDGDLDIYVVNFLDSDFWGFGMNRFAGNRNQLYLNQLIESGELKFLEVALTMKIAGLYKEEDLPHGIYLPSLDRVVETSKQFVNGKQVGEEADPSWAAQLADWNDDGWPDLVVANDVGGTRLRAYENQKGKGFRRLTQFDGPEWEGGWMGVNTGDLDGDGYSEIVVASGGSQQMPIRNTSLFIETSKEINISALTQINYAHQKNTLHHVLLSFRPEDGLKDVALKTEVHHSRQLPPDITNENNIMPEYRDFHRKMRFKDSLTGIEFAWAPVLFDVDNDGDLDIYFCGNLRRGNDGFWGDLSGNPGRLLVNESSPGKYVFKDLTVEYRLLDIMRMEYDHEPPRRRAPGTGWHKRDTIYITDVDSYSEMGLQASQESSTHDLIRMHEASFGMINGDLNNDGFSDLVVTHTDGAYNSLSPEAKNLKVSIDGKVRALPGTNKLAHPPTNGEPGKTFVYINGGVSEERDDANWIKLRLLDPDSKNLYGVGAKVIINDKIMRQITVGGPSFSSYSGDLLIGLGKEKVETIEIRWPSGSLKPQHIQFKFPIKNKLVLVKRGKK